MILAVETIRLRTSVLCAMAPSISAGLLPRISRMNPLNSPAVAELFRFRFRTSRATLAMGATPPDSVPPAGASPSGRRANFETMLQFSSPSRSAGVSGWICPDSSRPRNSLVVSGPRWSPSIITKMFIADFFLLQNMV